MVKSVDELADVMKIIWEQNIARYILGDGSNVLVSDKGIRGVVILNRAKEVRFETGAGPQVWCEAGVVFSNLANRCASKGLAGLEWAATVPGSVGGAAYGNAGAFGGGIYENLIWGELLTRKGCEKFSVEKIINGYVTTKLKPGKINTLILTILMVYNNRSTIRDAIKKSQF